MLEHFKVITIFIKYSMAREKTGKGFWNHADTGKGVGIGGKVYAETHLRGQRRGVAGDKNNRRVRTGKTAEIIHNRGRKRWEHTDSGRVV